MQESHASGEADSGHARSIVEDKAEEELEEELADVPTPGAGAE